MSDPSLSSRPPKKDEDERQAGEWSRIGQLAFEFLGYLALLGYFGWRMDQRYGWDGRGLFAGLILGMVAWLLLDALRRL